MVGGARLESTTRRDMAEGNLAAAELGSGVSGIGCVSAPTASGLDITCITRPLATFTEFSLHITFKHKYSFTL
jgi:hypothetical protein